MKLIDFSERRPDTWLRRLAEESPDRPFLIFPDEQLTLNFGECWKMGLAHSRFLVEHAGLRKGEHVGLMLPNCSAWARVWLGSILAGMVDVGIHHELGGHFLSHQLRSAKVKAVLCDQVTAMRLVALKQEDTTLPLHTLLVAGEITPSLQIEASTAGLKLINRSLADSCAQAEPVELDPKDLMSIRFTSGTTGPSKAGTLTVSQVCVWADYLVQLLSYEAGDRIYAPFPLHHHLASVMGVLGSLRAGGSCIVDRQFSARKFWPTCIEYGATLGLILTPVVNILLKAPEAQTDRINKVRAFYIAKPNREFEERFGSRLVCAYALTEANVLAYMTETSGNEESTCVGKINSHYEVQIFDEADQPVATGMQGEIVFRPKYPFTTMQSYFANPDATVKATGNLWFHTGDLGKMDAGGFLHFFERMGDTIRRRGVNISAYHIEEIALEYPGVEEAAAVGVPSSVGEFEIKLCVVPQPGAMIEPRAFIEWLCLRLPQEMVPRYFEARTSLPRTITEKIIKRELKEEGITDKTISTEPWIRHQSESANV